jgi:hypothetical protein
VDILQRGYVQDEYYKTGEVLRLHRHTAGNGITIVIIGDGFDREDCRRGGFYESECKRLAELFLSMPVYRDYKRYFDVIARVDVSHDRGVRNCVADPATCPDNAYGSGHPEIDFAKASANAALAAGDDRDYWYIFMGNGQIGGYAMGNMAVYSANEPSKHYWMMHEFAGHAFGGLPDMYYTGENGTMNANARASITANHLNGEILMLDWQTDPKLVYWKDFIGRNGYERVGIYPAGYYDPPLSFGEIFSCEPHDCTVMFGPTPYYSVMERYQIWRKIQLRAGFTTITIDEFLAYDAINLIDDWTSWDRYPIWEDDRVWTND